MQKRRKAKTPVYSKGLNRREFVKATGLTTGGLLLAFGREALFPRAGQAAEYTNIEFSVFEHFGDRQFRINLPKEWDIQEVRMKAHSFPPLTPQQIKNALNDPIGVKPLREMAYAGVGLSKSSTVMTTLRLG